MTPENQFKKFAVLFILLMAAFVVLNSSEFNAYDKQVKTSVQKKFFADTDTAPKEDGLLYKWSHSLNPKKYWISGKIKINTLSDYNRKTKTEIYTFRKYYVNKTIFRDKNYEPNKEVFGNIQDNAPWLGIKAQSCNGANYRSYRGMSKDSKFINNPAILVGVDYATYPEYPLKCDEEDYLIPSVMSFSKDKSTFILTYQIPENQKKRMFKLIGLNARDLGFNYAYSRKTNNIEFSNSLDNISKNVYKFKDAIRLDAACGVRGGCNNNLAYQEELFFDIQNSPATFELKLWKEKPESSQMPADMNFTIILE